MRLGIEVIGEKSISFADMLRDVTSSKTVDVFISEAFIRAYTTLVVDDLGNAVVIIVLKSTGDAGNIGWYF